MNIIGMHFSRTGEGFYRKGCMFLPKKVIVKLFCVKVSIRNLTKIIRKNVKDEPYAPWLIPENTGNKVLTSDLLVRPVALFSQAAMQILVNSFCALCRRRTSFIKKKKRMSVNLCDTKNVYFLLIFHLIGTDCSTHESVCKSNLLK